MSCLENYHRWKLLSSLNKSTCRTYNRDNYNSMGQIINTKNKIRPDYKWIVLTIFRHIPIFSNTLSSESCYFGANGSVLQTLLCDVYLGCSLPSNVKKWDYALNASLETWQRNFSKLRSSTALFSWSKQ